MADNRQFTDHNSIGNVNVYYKDRQLKERTAVSNSASIANLKFLLTTGDDEGFRTAIKSYIDEAIRSALGALVDNLDKGTGVSRILGTDSNHDLGTITPANLASVLGGITPDYSKLNWQSFNDYDFTCCFPIFVAPDESMTNGPFVGLYRGFLVVYAASGYIFQEYSDCNTHKGKRWVRAYGSGGWSEWIELAA